MKLINRISSAVLYRLGKKLGKHSKNRPDITHRFIIGIRDGMDEESVTNTYGFGDLLWVLWRRWYHEIAGANTQPPIPFTSPSGTSGKGKL